MSLRLLLAALAGWLDRRQQDAVAYLIEENRILRGHIRGRIRLTDAERRRLAVPGHRLGRRRLQDVATIVTPRHDSSMASAAHRAQMDVCDAAGRSSGRDRGDPAPGGPHGGGESHVGLHADRWCADERRSSSQPVLDRPLPESVRHATRARTADVVVDVSARALGRDRRRGSLHDGSVDVAWPDDPLHGVRHRPGLAPCTDRRIDTSSPRRV